MANSFMRASVMVGLTDDADWVVIEFPQSTKPNECLWCSATCQSREGSCRWSPGGPSTGCSSSPTPFSVLKPPSLTESPLSRKGSSTFKGLQRIAHIAGRELRGEDLSKKLPWTWSHTFPRNPGSPGYQSGAPVFVSNCSDSSPL